jgi:hypothetical protein
MDTRDRAIAHGIKSGHGNRSAERHYDSFAKSVEQSGWLNERAVALASYGGVVRGGIRMLPTGLRALRAGKATLKPHHKRPGAERIRKVFERYRQSTAQLRKER